jgi:hypothetical protein
MLLYYDFGIQLFLSFLLLNRFNWILFHLPCDHIKTSDILLTGIILPVLNNFDCKN